MTTNPTDGTVETSDGLTQDQAADAIFARMTAEPDAPADDAGDGAEIGNVDDETFAETEDGPDAPAEDAGPERTPPADDAEVEVVVDGEVRRITVRDLKRLAGQEAALTRKSQEVAARRKAADEREEASAYTLDALIRRAQERIEPYAQIDWLVAAQKLSPDELQALRAEARRHYEDYNFLTEEAVRLHDRAKAGRVEALREAAVAALPEIRERIAQAGGRWSPETYDGIRAYAVAQGFPQDEVDGWVNPAIIQMVYKASRYDVIKAQGPVKTRAAARSASPVRTTGAPAKAGPGSAAADKAMSRLKQTGSVEDAAAAIFARMTARRG